MKAKELNELAKQFKPEEYTGDALNDILLQCRSYAMGGHYSTMIELSSITKEFNLDKLIAELEARGFAVFFNFLFYHLTIYWKDGEV
jgi:hypothetical protein